MIFIYFLIYFIQLTAKLQNEKYIYTAAWGRLEKPDDGRLQSSNSQPITKIVNKKIKKGQKHTKLITNTKNLKKNNYKK